MAGLCAEAHPLCPDFRFLAWPGTGVRGCLAGFRLWNSVFCNWCAFPSGIHR